MVKSKPSRKEDRFWKAHLVCLLPDICLLITVMVLSPKVKSKPLPYLQSMCDLMCVWCAVCTVCPVCVFEKRRLLWHFQKREECTVYFAFFGGLLWSHNGGCYRFFSNRIPRSILFEVYSGPIRSGLIWPVKNNHKNEGFSSFFSTVGVAREGSSVRPSWFSAHLGLGH
jgi:hypothetical protein